MHRIIAALIILTAAALSGCTSVCPDVGQTGSLGLNERGWTGLTGLGVIGARGALCGAGLTVDKLQEVKSAEPTERDKLYKSLIALEDLQEKMEKENNLDQAEQLQLVKAELARVNARIKEIEK